MNEQLSNQTLNYLADQAVSENYDPTPLMRQRLATRFRSRKHQAKGERHQPRLSLAGLAFLLVLVAGTIFFVTPQGRGVAQTVIRFFNLAQNDILPLPTGQTTEPPHPTRTAAPTRVVELQEVTPAANASGALSFPTVTPVTDAKADGAKWNLTIEQAEQFVGFKLRVPVSLPSGYRLDNVIFDPRTSEVTQIYGFHPYSAGEQFILHQRPSKPTDVIGQSAIVEQMTVGGVGVEYVAGAWFGAAGASTESWHTDSIYHTFRWQEGDFFFTLEILFDDSDTWSPAYWTKDGMLAMVEIVMGVRAEFPEQININNLTSLDQAEKVAGFDLLVPSVLPEGFVFSRAVYEPQTKRILLFYQPQDGSRDSSGVRLVIIEKQKSDQSTGNLWDSYPPNALEQVMVGSIPAILVRGTLVDGVYQPDSFWRLVWSTTQLSIELTFSTRPDYPTRLEKAEMVAIAESMK